MGRYIYKTVEHEGIFAGHVRMIVIPDEIFNVDDLKGECYDPVVNSDIPAERLEAEERAFEKRVDDEGVYMITGQYKCPVCDSWEDADTVGGFVGDDWSGSGCDSDVIISAEGKLMEIIADLKTRFVNDDPLPVTLAKLKK